MSRNTFHAAAAVLVLGMAAMAAWALWALPADGLVPVHVNAAGAADRWARPGPGLFFLPLLALLLLGLRRLLPRIDPRGDNLRRSGKAYDTIWLAILGVLLLGQWTIVAAATGHALDAGRWMLGGIGAMFVFMGNVMGKLRWNYTVGIRTPWTIADERVWDQTHRYGGRLFVAGGLVLLLAALAGVPAAWNAPAIVGVAAVVAVASVLKSYRLWRVRQAGR